MISVVIPVYNAGRFADRCLQSLGNQTLTDWEAFVVDDGSTDDSREKIAAWTRRDPRVRLLRQQHRGVSAARNTGLDAIYGCQDGNGAATDGLIAFVDIDDYLHPQYLELMADALRRHPEAGMAMTLSVRTMHPDDASLRQRYAEGDVSEHDAGVLRRALFLGYRYITPNQCHTCHGKVFRRPLLDGQRFPEDYSVYEDAILMNRVLQRISRFVMVGQRLYFWVQHPGSKLASAGRLLLQGTRAYSDCLSDIPKGDGKTRAACLQRIFLHCAWLLDRQEKGTLEAVSAVEVSRAVRLRSGVVAELFLSRHIPFSGKWKLWTAFHFRRARQRLEKSMQVPAPPDQRGVGAAPVEQSGLVSVIIPVYNVAPYLPACVDSVLAQRYRKLEIILVDDGSTDGSGDLCDRYAERDSRVRVIHQEKQGAALARNAGLDQATGEYVLMPDGEDTLHPQMIHLLHKALRQGDFPLAMARWQGTEQKVAAMPELPRVAPLNLLTQRGLYLALTDRERGFVDVVVPWNKLYRRSVIGKLRFEGADSEGSIFHTRLYRRVAYAAVVDQPLYYRQQHGSLPGRHLQDSSVGDRLLAYAQNAEEMAGTVYAPWCDVFLYRSMASALKDAHGSRYHDRVYQTVRTIFSGTARRLLTCRAVPFTERLRLLFVVFVRSYFR